MHPAQHVGERRLAAVEDLEQGGDLHQRDGEPTEPALAGAPISMNGATSSSGAPIIVAAERTANIAVRMNADHPAREIA